MIFADASALIAIITGEAGADRLSDLLEADQVRLCSALSIWETVAGLCRSYMFSVPSARTHVSRFIDAADFKFVTIGEREFEVATDAYAQFGKGRHPAGLNMGDCYAYACAKIHGANLLFKGNDFAKTDIIRADELST
jgi:ribonuclease VapC